MSIAEHGAPTEREVQVLLIACAMQGRYVVKGSVNEAEARVAARRCVMRGFGEVFVDDLDDETFRINTRGRAYLADHLERVAAAP